MLTVKLPRPLVNELLHQAQLGADCEVCGLIGAHDDVPHLEHVEVLRIAVAGENVDIICDTLALHSLMLHGWHLLSPEIAGEYSGA